MLKYDDLGGHEVKALTLQVYRLLRVMYFGLILICFFIGSTLSIDSKKKSQFCCELTSTFSSILDPAFLLLVSLDPNKRILGQCFPSLIQCTRSQWQGFCLDRIGLHRGIFTSRFLRYDHEDRLVLALVSLVVATEWIMMALQRRLYPHGSKGKSRW